MSHRDVCYSCGSCGYSLNLSSSNRVVGTGNKYSKVTRKGWLSFLSIDESRFILLEEVKCGPFYESPESWGLQQMKTKLFCRECNTHIGYIQEAGKKSLGACVNPGNSPAQRRFHVKLRALQPTFADEPTDSQENSGQLPDASTTKEKPKDESL